MSFKLVMLKRGHRRWRKRGLAGPRRWPYVLRNEHLEIPISNGAGVIVLALLCNSHLTQEEMVEILWPDPDKQPDYWRFTMKHRVWVLNQKLAHFGRRIDVQKKIYRLVETNLERIAA